MTPDPGFGIRPVGLPAGWDAIWRALDAADRRAKNRGDLARDLGVSTHTLQRLLGDGDVPEFRHASVRQRRAWARTVARLARRFDADPVAWVRQAGIPIDAGVDAAIAGESRRERRKSDTPAPAAEATDLLGTLRRRAREGGSIEIGIVARPLLGDPLPGHQGSLLSELGRRVVGCVEPAWNVELREGAPEDLAIGLGAAGGRPGAALGLFDSALLRARGVELLPIPGWRPRLDALVVGGPAGTEPTPHPNGSFVVSEGDPGVVLLRAHRSINGNRIFASPGSSPDELARTLEDLAQRDGQAPVTLVADEGTCLAIRARVENRVGVGVDAELIPHPLHLRPGLALPTRGGEWRDALVHAWHHDLFDLARNETAILYGDQLLGAALRAHEAGSTPAAPAPWLAIEAFDAADSEFRRLAARRMLAGLMRARGLTKPDSAAASESAWERVVTAAHSVLLAPWRETFDRLAWTAKLELFTGTSLATLPLHGHCHSCSTSLRDYSGPADEFCTFCSDEQGRLRPRGEVRQMIAQWMRSWQDDLDEPESMRRAKQYMGALPAWSSN